MGGGNLERTLGDLFAQFGIWAYALLFLVVFVQCANPLGATMPGNPLVFVLGLLGRSTPGVSPWALIAVLGSGAFLGNLVGYLSGRKLGASAFRNPKMKVYEEKCQEFFAKHGPKAIFVGFFVPFVRCFLPLFAGVSGMAWRAFVGFSFAGAFTWVSTFVLIGFAFGEIPAVRQNLEYIVLGINAYVVFRLGLAIWRAKKAKKSGPDSVAR